MDRRRNPYTPGSGRRPATLAGRDAELRSFRASIARFADGSGERCPICFGPGGVGKTSLLLEFDVLGREAGWASTGVHEVSRQPDFRVTFSRMAAQLLEQMSRRHRARRRIARALRVVRAFSLAVPPGVRLKLDVRAASGVADSGDPEQDLRELLEEIGEVALHAGAGALFLIDEMQNLDRASLAAICMAFQAMSREQLPVAIAGAGLHSLPAELLEAKHYADRLFRYHELTGLAEEAARTALLAPAAAHGVHYREEAVRYVLGRADGDPYLIQSCGHEAWNLAAASPITLADVSAAGIHIGWRSNDSNGTAHRRRQPALPPLVASSARDRH